MNWKIKGFESVDGYNGATDADLDVALALCLAAKQWEYSDKYVYADEAQSLLSKIYSKEVTTKNGYKVFKPGDTWDNFSNPCYFTVASVGVFDQAQEDLGFSSTRDWASVYTGAHKWLELTQKNGLWPNWAHWDGSLGCPNYENADDYGWDACRTPWRVAWDYLWFGNASSKGMIDKTLAFMDAQGILTGPNGKAGFYKNLSASDYSGVKFDTEKSYTGNNAAFIGAFASALMCDENMQSNLDSYHSTLKNRTESPYYAPTLQILYLLTTSGNAANFFDCDNGGAVVNPVITSATTDGNSVVLTSSKTLKSSSNYNGFSLYQNGTKMSNVFSGISISGKTITLNLKNITIESTDGISISYEGDYLLSEEDGVLGKTALFPVKNKVSGGSTLLADCENGEVTLLGGTWYSYVGNGTQSYEIVSGGANSTAHSAHFTYSGVTNYAGMGFNILEEEAAYDFSGSTGITFYHKGSAATLEIGTSVISDYSYHVVNVESHASWTPVTVEWENVSGPGWGDGDNIDFVSQNLCSKITKFQWKVISGTGEFYIDEVVLMGKTIDAGGVDKSALEATIATANSLYGGATTDQYPESAITALYNAIVAAGTVNMNSSATEDQVSSANSTLIQAIATFKATAYADKSPLSKAIATATVLSNNASIGTANGDYPQSAKDDLDAAIASAQTVYNKVGLTETEMNSAIDALNTAINTFKASVLVIADKSELKDLIAVATSILNTTEAGTQVGQYSAAKRKSLENALKNAQDVYDDASSSQSLVNIRVSSLKAAYNAYMSSKVTSTAVDDVEFALAIYPNPCTDVLSIESSNVIAKVNIVGMNGVKYSSEIDNTSSQIEVSRLGNGVYSLQIFFEDGTIKVMSFVKK
jgi:endo-1,4-beta-D-glucanase Y